jgi:hypothetical protein
VIILKCVFKKQNREIEMDLPDLEYGEAAGLCE